MCRSQIELERYFTGDLPPADADRVRRHVEGCPECGAKLAEFEAEKIRFLNVYPFEDFAKKERRAANISAVHKIAEFFRTPWSLQLYGGAAVVTALLLLLIPVYLDPYEPEPESVAAASTGIRYKGPTAVSEAADMAGASGLGLSFLYMRDGEMRTGSVDEAFKEGDKLQFVYSHSVKHYAALFSIDNTGTVSFYTGDERGVVSVASDSGSGLTFPASVVLDDSRGEELVIALISDSLISGGEVTAWVGKLAGGGFGDLSRVERALGEDGLGGKAAVSSIRIKKE